MYVCRMATFLDGLLLQRLHVEAFEVKDRLT